MTEEVDRCFHIDFANSEFVLTVGEVPSIFDVDADKIVTERAARVDGSKRRRKGDRLAVSCWKVATSLLIQ